LELKDYIYNGRDIVIVDCREADLFTIGHIKNAVNLCTKEEVKKHFFTLSASLNIAYHAILFYCDSSCEQSQKMATHLRNIDERENKENKFYPTVKILNDGYSDFFDNYHSDPNLIDAS